MSPSSHSLFSRDNLFRQIVEAEVDMAKPNLPLDTRHACIGEVLERMNAEIVELLAGGGFMPQLLTVRIQQEVRRVLEPGANAA